MQHDTRAISLGAAAVSVINVGHVRLTLSEIMNVPPDLLTQLLERGIRPRDITHLVITHAHFDHYAGTTLERDGRYVPSFPRARCFLGKADWDHPETQEALHDPTSADSRTFGVLQQAGLLE